MKILVKILSRFIPNLCQEWFGEPPPRNNQQGPEFSKQELEHFRMLMKSKAWSSRRQRDELAAQRNNWPNQALWSTKMMQVQQECLDTAPWYDPAWTPFGYEHLRHGNQATEQATKELTPSA